MSPPWGIDLTTHCTISRHSTTELHPAPQVGSMWWWPPLRQTMTIFGASQSLNTLDFYRTVCRMCSKRQIIFSKTNNGSVYEGRKCLFVVDSTHWHPTYGNGPFIQRERKPAAITAWCTGSFICTTPTDRIAHTMAFVTPFMEIWFEREIDQWVYHEGLIWWPITPWANTLTMGSVYKRKA